MPNYSTPDSPLPEVQEKVLRGFWHITQQAQHDALALIPSVSVRLCLLGLTEADFHKAMDAEEPKWKGAIQDVYKPTVDGLEIYVKFQNWPLNRGMIYVVSFKEK